MKKHLFILLIFFLTSFVYSQKMDKTKKEIINSVENHKEEIISISDKIWALAETSFEEFESSKLLSDYAEKNGFSVEKGVAGMPTAFVATYGEGKPVISVLGEFDALPGLSQDTSPEKKPLEILRLGLALIIFNLSFTSYFFKFSLCFVSQTQRY